jgi:NAD(P) transhydrogenase subunit alpha
MNAAQTINSPLMMILTVFVLACFVGYYVVWKVTPALHTPLMSVTNAISSIIILGALMVSGQSLFPSISWLGGLGIFITAINIFGGFVVTQRMLALYKKE